MNSDLRLRLRKLGVTKGARNLKPAPPVKKDNHPFPSTQTEAWRADFGNEEPLPLEELLPGGRLEAHPAADQPCFVLDKIYPLSHQHGDDPLETLLAHSPQPAAVFLQDERFAQLSFRDFLFVDTETTGLGGVGTLVFLVGVAYFEGDALTVRQFFLRDHADESAMLHLLSDLLKQKQGLITFNGRTFDLPLLDNRYLMNRLDPPEGDLLARPHIDLLQPARRLWRGRFKSCALGSLEENLLSVQRSHDDIPGWAIPSVYAAYLREGDTRPLSRVFYHNHLDILSMVTLAARIVRIFDQPAADDHPLELLGCGKWKASLGLIAQAEEALRLACACDHQHRGKALWTLGGLLKKQGRRHAAVPLWEQIAAESLHAPNDITSYVELAKYYEWHAKDFGAALSWTEQALDIVDKFDIELADELRHRHRRLEKKLLNDFMP